MGRDVLDLLHLVDSAFPNGAYVHSGGLETLAPADPGALEQALAVRTRQSLGRFELVFLVHAFAGDLLDLDQRYHVMLLAREIRDASARIGTQLLRSACDVFDVPRAAEFLRRGRHHHYPLAFGALAADLAIESSTAASAYALGSLRGQVSAAQRLGWIGQRDAQRVLHALKPTVREAVHEAEILPLDDAGAFVPRWDIAAMAHAWAPVRLFAS